MRQYELVIVVDPEADEERVGGVVDRVKQLVSGAGGGVTDEDAWGRRKLAYPIGKFSEGQYYRAKLQMEPELTAELERSLNLAEDVIRHMLVIPQKPRAGHDKKEKRAGHDKKEKEKGEG